MLDARLQCIADLVSGCELAADIGADHGRLACHLLAQGIAKQMIVSDISDDSLSKSRKLLHLHSLSHRAEFIVADGLDALTKPVDTVIIAGMGGKTIAQMMAKHQALGDARLIVSAHTQMHLLREKLFEYGFFFETERVVSAGGRFYTVLMARRGQAEYTKRELYLGTALQSDCLLEYLSWRRAVAATRRDQNSALHLTWIDEEIERERRKQSANL